MAEAVVSSVGQTIGNLLINEAKFLWDVKGKVEDLYRELRLIRCLLRDADTRQEHNQAVGECVAQLRDFAYDAEDVIERYTLRVKQKKGQYITRACACFLAKCMCLQVHEVGTEIEGLKSRISNLRTSMLAFGALPADEGELKRTRALMLKRKYDHFKEDFVGREDSVKELVKELLNDGEMHRVIFIWGMGGLGKTSLAKKVVAHDKVKNNFDSLAWACVSQEYHPKDILVAILLKLVPDKREDFMNMTVDELVKTLYETQQNKRCIVVLDDIWTKEAWDSLREAFPIENTGSKLLITTRNREVAKYIDRQGFLHELRCLSYEESWDLLMKRVFPETKTEGPGVSQGIVGGQPVEGIARQSKMEGQIPPVITEDMKKLAYELVKKCAGLPLAVIVLGGLLAVNEWKTVHDKINLHFSDKSDVSKVLALSYDDLLGHLKPCFLYFGSFPKDAEIPATKILHMWIAEGFVSLNAYDKEREISMEDIAEQYLMELVNRGMVQVRYNLSGNIKTCHLHDLMRDLCISKVLQESFLSISNIRQDSETKNYSPSMAIEVESSSKIRRLSLNGNMILSLKSIEGTLVHLRTLMFFNPIVEQIQLIFNCKFLRILKLEELYLRGNLPESLGDLVHLRFLSLVGSGFCGMPQSMGNLVCMEFLDLLMKTHDVVTMPNVLWKMRKLRYLRFPYKFAIKEKFLGDQKKLRLDTLKNLRTLRNFSLEKCDVNDVSELTNLQKLTILDQYNPIKLEIFPQLAEFNWKHLRSSSFYFGNSDCLWSEGQLSKMSNYDHLRKLSINGKIERLPEHKSLPQQLRKLVLLNSQLEDDPMPILEKLENLIFLKLEKAFKGKEIICSAGGFPQLKHLVISLFPLLEEWRVAEGAMPHLSRVRIHACHNLKVPPSHVPTDDSWHEVVTDVMDMLAKDIYTMLEEELGSIERRQTICCLGAPLCIG